MRTHMTLKPTIHDPCQTAAPIIWLVVKESPLQQHRGPKTQMEHMQQSCWQPLSSWHHTPQTSSPPSRSLHMIELPDGERETSKPSCKTRSDHGDR
mmetsp:Transcript_14987/g.42067  ORF Transcript_14987/g.42067 Transcript_14987/m.42067 type:complete len:96 (-) Transcript_14987:389-676(-)